MDLSPVSTVINTPELLWNLLLRADFDTVLEYCRSYDLASQICSQNVFWQQKAELMLNISRDVFYDTKLNAAQRYLQLLTQKGGIAKGSERYITLNAFVRKAIQQNRDHLVQYALELGFNNWKIPLFEYAAKGNIKLVNYYLKLDPDYQRAREGAAKGGDIRMFNYISLIAPNKYPWDWNLLALNALLGGHKNLFDDIRSLSSFDYNIRSLSFNDNFDFDWDWNSLARAASKNRELFNYVISLAPPDYSWDWNFIARYILSKGNKEMFDYIFSLVPPDYEWSWDYLAGFASTPELYNYIISLAPLDYPWDYDELLSNAAWNSNKEVFDYILSLAPLDYEWNWNYIAKHAILSKKKEMVNYVFSLVPDYEWDWNYLEKQAIISEKKEMMDYIFSLAPPDYEWDWDYLVSSATYDRKMFDYIFSLAPQYYPWDLNRLTNKAIKYGNIDLANYIQNIL